jgi:hypothetical protein
MKFIKIFNFCTLFSIYILCFTFYVYSAWYQWDVAGWLEEKAMEAESDDRFENLAKDFNFANLYKTIYETV